MCQYSWKGKCEQWLSIAVNGNHIKELQKNKYLGDYITKNANPKATIEDRKNKAMGNLSKMHAILYDIPLGSKCLEIGLTLRTAWFVIGTLFNSEVWNAFTNNFIKVLELLDQKILWFIIEAQGKVPCEMLYLETGALDSRLELRHVIAVRRIVYITEHPEEAW